jgi:hypothetical protein
MVSRFHGSSTRVPGSGSAGLNGIYLLLWIRSEFDPQPELNPPRRSSGRRTVDASMEPDDGLMGGL